MDGSRLRTLNNHTATVTDLALRRPPGDETLQLVSTSEDRTVRLWQPSIGRMIKFIRLESIPRRVIAQQPHELVAACDDGSLVVIDCEEMKVVKTIKTQIAPIHEMVLASPGILVAGATALNGPAFTNKSSG